VVLATLVVGGCSSAPPKPEPIPPGDYTYAAEYLEWRIDRLMAEHDLPAVAIALVDDQEVVWQESWGYADLGRQIPADPDTVWRVGSITKLLTAFEVMRLSEEGVVDLDEPLTTTLPEFEVRTREADPEPITLRSMLAHRSGLPRNSGLPSWYWDAGADVLQVQTDELALWYVAHPVGVRYHYSNAAFNVMANVVDRTRGPFPFYMRDELLRPIGMEDSAFLFQDLADGATVAMGYHGGDEGNEPYDQGDLIRLGSGNLYATVPDLADLIRFVLRDGEVDGEALLEPETLWSMYEVQYDRPRDPKPMGLAWFTSRTRFPELLVHHTGTVAGTESMIALLPESKLGVAVVSNSDRFGDLIGSVAVEALDLMLETKTGDLPLEPDEGEAVRRDPEVLERFVGTWVCDGDLVSVFRNGHRLKARVGGTTLRLVPLAGGGFRVDHWLGDPGNMKVRFFVGDADEEDIMVIAIEEMEHVICPRYPAVNEVPPLWEEIAGRYRAVPRVESTYFDGDFGEVEAVVEDGTLRLGGLRVWPLSPSELRVVGGEWDGETVLRDPETGEMVFQHERDIPL